MDVDESFCDTALFACEDREHLLLSTWHSFQPSVSSVSGRLILSIDGLIPPSTISEVSPNLVVHNPHRLGYLRSILTVLRLIDSEFFFWLEDDWQMEVRVDILEAIRLLRNHPNWLQVRWSKAAPLDPVAIELDHGVRHSVEGFSANPCVCRTALVRDAFAYLLKQPPGNSLGVDGFENVISRWSGGVGLICAVFDPGSSPAVSHTGYLESTGREWHMTSSLTALPTEHLLSFGRPSLVRRCWMAIKLIGNAMAVAWKQFRNDGAYELAFRFVTSARPLRKERVSAKDRDPQ
ncbi:MAG: hypothetical protein QOH88_3586 [Verrucomicrobiota bacterium]|jgi:hypothetical protein